MLERLFIARLFWIVGSVLTVLGIVLWLVVPIRPMFPPYLATALTAFAYGEFCRRRSSAADPPKP
jgi:hypothetical protein